MTEWYLWDGESQRGPMDRSELDNRVQYHPAPKTVRVWRDGFPDWKTVEEALNVTQKSALDPSTFERPCEPSKETKYRNFVAQNWRGEYPLWVSYWIIGLLTNVFAVAVASVVGAFTAESYHPFGVLAFLLMLWSSIAALSVWHLVGIWRSAQRRIAERAAAGKRAPWAGLAKIMVCLGAVQIVGLMIRTGIPQLAEATSIAFMDDPDIPSYSIRVMNDGSEAEIAGGIKFGLSSDFEKILNASRGVRVVHLDSIGGRLGEGKKLNALIKSRDLDTYVDVKCLSACTLAFVAGRQRILKHGAQLGFHRGAFAGEDELDGSLERAVYVAAGVSSPFIDRALATKNADMWRPSEADLISAGVVTKISTGDEYAIASDAGRLTRDDWDKGLQKTAAVYAVMKEKYPKSYNEILDTFLDGSTKGTPQAQIMRQARAKLSSLVKTMLPYADDAVLIEFGRLVVDQYRAIQSQDKVSCYRFASGEGDENIVRLIPKDLLQRELEVDAQILSSARKQNGPVNNEAAWDTIRAGLTLRGYTAKDLQLLAGKSIDPADYARYCDFTIALYQEVVALPAVQAGGVLRDIFS
jgi:hypothetical protein